MPRPLRYLLLILALKAGAYETALAQTSELELKAAFIFTLTKYVDWPTDRLSEGSPLRVCFVTHADPLAVAMQPLAGRLVRGHPLEIRAGATSTVPAGCHVQVNPPLPLKGSPSPGLLLLCERAGAVDAGCHVGLFIDDNRARFDANLTSARQVGLQLSAQLLKLARQVR